MDHLARQKEFREFGGSEVFLVAYRTDNYEHTQQDGGYADDKLGNFQNVDGEVVIKIQEGWHDPLEQQEPVKSVHDWLL